MAMWLSPRLWCTALLFVMVEKWRQCLDTRGVSGAFLTGLSKAFVYILHNLLLAKLAAYGLNYNSLQILQCYLSNRKQRAKINDAYSKYCEILLGVPQGSILGSLQLNFYIFDMFYEINDCNIVNNADADNLCASSSDLYVVINKIEESTNNLLQSFINNNIKLMLTNTIFWLQVTMSK